MSDLKQLSRAIIIAGACIGLGLAAPAIIASMTQHQRYTIAGRVSGGSYAVLDTRKGEICYPERALRGTEPTYPTWKSSGRKCYSIEITE